MRRSIFKVLIILGIVLAPTILSYKNSFGVVRSPEEAIALTNYLPLLFQTYPKPPPTFGAQVSTFKVNRVVDSMEQANLAWVRINAFDWDEIEPIKQNSPTYIWDEDIEFHLKAASSNGLKIIATIRFAPDWAQQYPSHACGPIKSEALQNYGQFLKALVQKYSQAPYNIKYWELGNEPDVDFRSVEDRSPFGCWGNADEEFFGGEYYAEMLKVAYPAIKSADPIAQVLIGGLLLDCDPTDPPDNKSCHAAKFFEGILRNGGGSYFDVVSFHGYPPYSGSQGGGLAYDEHFLGWESRGGVVLGKINYLREVMANFGLNKPIMHTEGSLICPSCEAPDDVFFDAQADYVVWLYVRNIAEGIKSTIWYQFDGPGWRFGGLLDENQNPKPAYRALNFLTEELSGTTYKSLVTNYPSLKGYEFRNAQKRIWVLWSPDGGSHTIDLPLGFQRVLNKYGKDITPPVNSITVGKPIYIELKP